MNEAERTEDGLPLAALRRQYTEDVSVKAGEVEEQRTAWRDRVHAGRALTAEAQARTETTGSGTAKTLAAARRTDTGLTHEPLAQPAVLQPMGGRNVR